MTTSKAALAPTSSRSSRATQTGQRGSQPVSSSSSSSVPSPRFLLMRRWEEQQGVRAQAILSMNLLGSNHYLLPKSDNDAAPTSNASSAITTRDSVVCMLDEALMIVGADFTKSFGSVPTKAAAMTTTTSRRSFGTTNSTASTLSFDDQSVDSAGPADDVTLVKEETAAANVERDSDQA